MKARVVRVLSLAGLAVVLLACGEDTKTITEQVFPECSETYPFGMCPDGEGCMDGACVDLSTLCSADNLTGVCAEGATCFEGACMSEDLLCSASNPTGLCGPGEVCNQGTCGEPEDPCPDCEVEFPDECGPANIDGPCPTDQTCMGGVCMADDALCSATNTTGVCDIGSTCLDGTCLATVSLCSGVNPTGTCAGDMECNGGICVEPDEVEVDPCTIHVYTTQPTVVVHNSVSSKDIITVDGLDFRDLNDDGELNPYEDWRLLEICRAEDLVSRMTTEQKIGLFISGSSIGDVGDYPTISDDDTEAIVDDHRRQSLIRTRRISDPVEMAAYFNLTQELAEAQPLGIPIVILTDPSHGVGDGLWSNWPGPLGLGAIGDVDVTWQYGDTVRQEYMAGGLRMQYGPMADLATEPRWRRVSGTFGENAWAVARHVAATVSGFQGSTTGDIRNGIIATPKHFPGHGAEFDGLDAHSYEGRNIVFPGDNFMYHTIPFQAAFDVGARAIMPCYGIYVGQTDWDPEQVGTGYSYGMITELAKEYMGHEGLVTADWGAMSRMAHGVETLSMPQRVQMWFDAGSHQFGSESDQPIFEAYDTGLIGDVDIDEAATKILENFFKLGLFENPYVDSDAADDIVQSVEFRRYGFEAQKLAIVLLRNFDHTSNLREGRWGGAPTADGLSYLPISGTRYEDYNDDEEVQLGEHICDTNGDEQVAVWYEGDDDGLVGSDDLDDFLDTYDYTWSANGTSTLAIVDAGTLSTADIAVLRIGSQSSLDFEGSRDAEAVIDLWRVRDGYYNFDVTCASTNAVPDVDEGFVDAVNPDLKIILVMEMDNATLVQPFLAGLDDLDDVLAAEYECPSEGDPEDFPMELDDAVSYPTLWDNLCEDEKCGVDGFLVDFGAFDRAVLDVLFNVNIPTGDGLPAPTGGWRYGMAVLPIEIPNSMEQIELQFEDVPNDTVDPTFQIGFGTEYDLDD